MVVTPGSSSSGRGTVTTPLWPASSSSEALSPGQGPEAVSWAEGERLFQVDDVGAPERRRARLLVAYVGTGFHGFARQRGVTTVASALAGAVERVVRHPVELT